MEKVRSFIARHFLLYENDIVVVAVSGGPDSLTLLHMLNSISKHFKLKLVVAHLNHCMRPEADQEEAAVIKLAKEWSLAYESRSVKVRELKSLKKVSEEEAGRLARYRLFYDTAFKYGASKIALGHHLDDQAETVLLNILRGTGVDGLAGILPKNSQGGLDLIRPLLCLRRTEIEEYCREMKLEPFTDSSNLETDYTRNKLRLELIPQLEKKYNPRIREALFGLATLAAEDRHLLNALSQKKYLEIASFGDKETFLNRVKLLKLPLALSSRILRKAHKKYAPQRELNSHHLGQILTLLESNKTSGQVTLPGNTILHLSQEQVIITSSDREKKSSIFPTNISVPGKTPLADGSIIEASFIKKEELSWPPIKYQAYLDYDSLSSGKLIVRARWPGARFHPQGLPGSKKLKDFFIDQKIPRFRRDQVPLITDNDKIVWVVGFRIAEQYRVTEKTNKVLVLAYKKKKLPRLIKTGENRRGG